MITVFTPMYNRAHTIFRLYESLEKQTCKSFEWVIVDDGSTDNTTEILQEISSKASFPVKTERQANAGKHAAINRGVEIASGNLFFIVDSDDYLQNNAVERILSIVDTLPKGEISHFAGISGVRVTPGGISIGTSFNESYIDCTAFERYKHNINGDKSEVYFTDILTRYPFPVFEGENFLTESVIWYRIANDGYKIRWTNEPYYICEYQEDGLSNTTGKCSRCFNGYHLTTKEMLQYKQLPFKVRCAQLLAYSAIAYKEKKDLGACAGDIGVPHMVVSILGRLGLLAFKIRTSLFIRKKRHEK